MFCPELWKLLKLIYDFTRKGRQFIWGKEQQNAFKEVKHMLHIEIIGGGICIYI